MVCGGQCRKNSLMASCRNGSLEHRKSHSSGIGRESERDHINQAAKRLPLVDTLSTSIQWSSATWTTTALEKYKLFVSFDESIASEDCYRALLQSIATEHAQLKSTATEHAHSVPAALSVASDLCHRHKFQV